MQSWSNGACFPLRQDHDIFALDLVDIYGAIGRFRVDDEPAAVRSGQSTPSIRMTEMAPIRLPIAGDIDARWLDCLGPRLCDNAIATAVCERPWRLCSTDAFDLVTLIVHLRHLSDDDGTQDRYLQLLEHLDSTWRGPDPGAFDMCPVAGRVCEMHGRLLHVYDYLPPPSDFSPPLDA